MIENTRSRNRYIVEFLRFCDKPFGFSEDSKDDGIYPVMDRMYVEAHTAHGAADVAMRQVRSRILITMIYQIVYDSEAENAERKFGNPHGGRGTGNIVPVGGAEQSDDAGVGDALPHT